MCKLGCGSRATQIRPFTSSQAYHSCERLEKQCLRSGEMPDGKPFRRQLIGFARA